MKALKRDILTLHLRGAALGIFECEQVDTHGGWWLGTLEIEGVSFHVEVVEVEEVKDPDGPFPATLTPVNDNAPDLSEPYEARNSDGETPQTINIDGHRMMVMIEPYAA